MLFDLRNEDDIVMVRYTYNDSFHRLFFMPLYDKTSWKNYDVANALEYTLHKALDNDMSDEDLYYYFGFMPEGTAQSYCDENDLLYIDLGYYINSQIYAIEPLG